VRNIDFEFSVVPEFTIGGRPEIEIATNFRSSSS